VTIRPVLVALSAAALLVGAAPASAQSTGCVAGPTGDPVQDCVRDTTGLDAAGLHRTVMRSGTARTTPAVQFVAPDATRVRCQLHVSLFVWFPTTGDASVRCTAPAGTRIAPRVWIDVQIDRTVRAGTQLITYARGASTSCAHQDVGVWVCYAPTVVDEYSAGALYRLRAETTIEHPGLRVLESPSCHSPLGHAPVRCVAEATEAARPTGDQRGEQG
jgi:hypothetical protein